MTFLGHIPDARKEFNELQHRHELYNYNAFMHCWHILKTVKNVIDRPPVETKTVQFLPVVLKTADFENVTLNRHILKTASSEHSKMMRKEHFSTLLERN